MTKYEKAMYNQGRNDALSTQKLASKMTDTELNEKDDTIPDFQAAVKVENMLNRQIGFVCKSSAGRVVRLLQPYDSNIFPQEPEELTAQWGFAWSTDPKKAKPFVSIATSPYNKGDCCIFDNVVQRSKIDNNVYSPKEYPDGWEIVNLNPEELEEENGVVE